MHKTEITSPSAMPAARWQSYVFAIVASLGVILLRMTFANWFGDRLALVMFVIPIALSAYMGGLWPGLLSTVMLALYVEILVIPPTYSIAIARPTDLAQWLILILTGVLISFLFAEQHRTRRRPESNEGTGPMDLAAERKVTAGFGFALICLAVIGVASFLAIKRQNEDIGWVQHTFKVVGELDQLYAKSIQAQNARGAYIITGNESFIDAYDGAIHMLQTSLEHLRQLTNDNTGQHERTQQLAESLAAEIAYSSANIEVRHKQGFAAAQALSLTGKGKQLHDRTQGLIEAMKQSEEALLKVREHNAARQTDFVQAIIISGGIIAIVGLGLALLIIRRDFARRRQAEAERDRFFQLSPDIQYIGDAQGNCKRINPAVERILGWTPAEFCARPFFEFTHPDDLPKTQQTMHLRFNTGSNVALLESRHLHQDGSWRVLSWAVVPHGSLIYAIARDITQRKQIDIEIARLNSDLQSRAALLEAANKELESFSYSVSHDLRAPLRHVQGYVELLTRDIQHNLSSTAARYLKVIADAGREMSELIDNLLSFSRMGRAEMNSAAVDLNPLIEAVRHDLHLTTEGRSIRWQITTLPRVIGDRAMLKQVFANLLSNAIKYTRNRAVAEIEIGYRPDEDMQANRQYIFYVRDNGAGFDMKYADKLFGVFQRLHRVDEYEGTGIGLANVRRIIMRHGGRTWADAKLDGGATLFFTLKPATAITEALDHEAKGHIANR